MALKNMVKLGARVTFGRAGDAKQSGTVVQLNPKTAYIKLANGTVMSATYNLIQCAKKRSKKSLANERAWEKKTASDEFSPEFIKSMLALAKTPAERAYLRKLMGSERRGVKGKPTTRKPTKRAKPKSNPRSKKLTPIQQRIANMNYSEISQVARLLGNTVAIPTGRESEFRQAQSRFAQSYDLEQAYFMALDAVGALPPSALKKLSRAEMQKLDEEYAAGLSTHYTKKLTRTLQKKNPARGGRVSQYKNVYKMVGPPSKYELWLAKQSSDKLEELDRALTTLIINNKSSKLPGLNEKRTAVRKEQELRKRK
jgi:hypothetical protein